MKLVSEHGVEDDEERVRYEGGGRVVGRPQELQLGERLTLGRAGIVVDNIGTGEKICKIVGSSFFSRKFLPDVSEFVVPKTTDGDQDVPRQQDREADQERGPVDEVVLVFRCVGRRRRHFRLLLFHLGVHDFLTLLCNQF